MSWQKWGSDEEQTRLEGGASFFDLGPRFKSQVQLHDLDKIDGIIKYFVSIKMVN